MDELITVDEALNYLGIDYADDSVLAQITRMIKTADSILKGSIGEAYPKDDPRAKELALIIVADLYDNRGLHSNITGNTRKLVDDMSWQLRLELRIKTDE